MSETRSVAVVGGGLWGRALASAAARTGCDVLLISRRTEDPPPKVRAATAIAEAARARLVLLAVPSAHATSVAAELGPHLDGGHFLVHGVRGLIGDDLRTISEAVRDEMPVRRLGALGGPVLATELADGSPSMMVVGSRYREVREVVIDAFGSNALRVYPTADLIGLEWASALTGCMAIAIGYALGAGLGPGLVAAFTTRAVHEAARVAYAAGGEHATLLDLAGLGDLLAAAGQRDRPEIVLGRCLAEGKSLDEARTAAGERTEAVALLPKLRDWTHAKKVAAPILSTIASSMLEGRPRDRLIHDLMVTPILS